MRLRELVRGINGAIIAVAVLVAVLAVALVRLELRADPPDGLEARAEAIMAEASDASAEVVTPVELQVRLAPGDVALAPAWTGLVTEVLVASGDAVASGTELLSVDGVRRLAVATPSPFHRAIGVGDRGADVEMLAALLGELGYLPSGGSTSVVDARMAAAIGALASVIGASVDADDDATFDPSWTVWIPADELVVTGVQARVAAAAPAPGEAVVAFRPAITSVGVPAERLPPAGSALTPTLEVRLGEVTAPVVDGVVELDDGLGEALTASLDGAVVPSDDPAASSSEVSVPAELLVQWPADVTTVPLTSLVTTAGGEQCVVQVDGDARQGVLVSVVGSETARAVAFVVGVAPGTPVVANPASAGEAAACNTPAPPVQN